MITLGVLGLMSYSTYLSYLDNKGKTSYTWLNFVFGGLLLGAFLNRLFNKIEGLFK